MAAPWREAKPTAWRAAVDAIEPGVLLIDLSLSRILEANGGLCRLSGHGHALARERCSAAGMAAEHESLYRSLTGFDARPSASRGRR